MKPSECPSFYSCSAAICPIAPDEGHHLAGDRVCPRARRIHLGKAPADAVHAAIAAGMPRVAERFPLIAVRWTAPWRPMPAETVRRKRGGPSGGDVATGEATGE